jgi:hypothetical protein
MDLHSKIASATVAPFYFETQANNPKASFSGLQKSGIDVLHGIMVRKMDSAGVVKFKDGQTPANNAAFLSAYLNLYKRSEVIQTIALDLIDNHCKNNPLGYYPVEIEQPNLSLSNVEIGNKAAIVNGEYFEIYFIYHNNC